jgi:IS1 family transposase
LKNRGIEVKIVSSNQVLVAEAEFDEIWSYVSDKSRQYWLWWAIDHNTGVPLRIVLVRENTSILMSYAVCLRLLE